VIENLKVSGMLKNHRLASALADCGFYEFRRAIDTESVSEEAKALMLVDVYWEEYDKVKSGFLFAAATPLEKLVQSGNQTPVIHRLLGDIYLRLGRWQEAEEKYQKVILLAESEKNPFEIPAAQEGLAHVAVIKGDFSEARKFLLEAKQGYQIAGDGKQVELIQGWLEKLESMPHPLQKLLKYRGVISDP
jgi:tetratricopeptide (TPR) repeat protein